MKDSERKKSMQNLAEGNRTLADSLTTAASGSMIPAAIFEGKGSIQIMLKVPGMRAKDLYITVENKTVTVSGERKFEKEEQEQNVLRDERSYGKFSRSFTFPSINIENTEVINASLDNGVLNIRLAKRANFISYSYSSAISPSAVVVRRIQKPGSEDEVAQFAKVLAHAVETFGSRANANVWLNRPSRIFGHQSPLQILTEDPSAVEEELVRIDHGMFV